MNLRSFIKGTIPYILLLSMTTVILTVALQLWRASPLTVPFNYGGDGLFTCFLIKTILQEGWYTENDSVGMPYGLKLHDFPNFDNFDFLVIKLAGLFSGNHIAFFNLYILLAFYASAITAFYVFKRLKISVGPALMGALLFAFLPFHFFRAFEHLSYAAYYIVPLIVLLAFMVQNQPESFFKKPAKKQRFYFVSSQFVPIVLICLVASTKVYYAFFGSLFISAAGFMGAYRKKSIVPVIAAGTILMIITAGVFFNMAPALLHKMHYGPNSEVANRSFIESELYGLKVTNLVLPVPGHRIKLFSDLTHAYNSSVPPNENSTVSLGIIGTLGFFILILVLFLRYDRINDLMTLSIFNIVGLLWATIGGFGVLFALLVSPSIRGLNRICVYISFFSILAVVILLDSAYKRYFQTETRKILFHALLVSLLLIGMFDQTASHFVPPYEKLASEYQSENEFIRKIESSIPQSAMVFQLPYMPFPENGPIHKMLDYGPLKAYMHSTHIRWSYAAMRGRESDLWQKMLRGKPIEQVIETLSFAGFEGIYVDRDGYADQGANLKESLSAILGIEPYQSSNNHLQFFSMVDFNKRHKEMYSTKEWELRRDNALYPTVINWARGFYNLEEAGGVSWRWCSSHGELQIFNMGNKDKSLTLSATFISGVKGTYNLSIRGLVSQDLQINETGKLWSNTFTVPPGKHIMTMRCNAPSLVNPNDSRSLVFRMVNQKAIIN